MNEYHCDCGEYFYSSSILKMLDRLAIHMQECEFASSDSVADNAYLQQTNGLKRRPYPTRALYHGRVIRILGYAGAGDFIVQDGETQTTINRRHFTFTRR